MEWLLSLAPIALVLLVCGGMHMVMMRGMHGGHDAAPRHGGNLSATDPENEARPIKLVRRSGQADANEANRIAELETQVASLQEEIDAILTYRRSPGNGSNFGRVAAPHHTDVAWRNDSRPGAAQGESDDDSNQ